MFGATDQNSSPFVGGFMHWALGGRASLNQMLKDICNTRRNLIIVSVFFLEILLKVKAFGCALVALICPDRSFRGVFSSVS